MAHRELDRERGEPFGSGDVSSSLTLVVPWRMTPAQLTDQALTLIERADVIVRVTTLARSRISAADPFLALVERLDLAPATTGAPGRHRRGYSVPRPTRLAAGGPAARAAPR